MLSTPSKLVTCTRIGISLNDINARKRAKISPAFELRKIVNGQLYKELSNQGFQAIKNPLQLYIDLKQAGLQDNEIVMVFNKCKRLHSKNSMFIGPTKLQAIVFLLTEKVKKAISKKESFSDFLGKITRTDVIESLGSIVYRESKNPPTKISLMDRCLPQLKKFLAQIKKS